MKGTKRVRASGGMSERVTVAGSRPCGWISLAPGIEASSAGRPTNKAPQLSCNPRNLSFQFAAKSWREAGSTLKVHSWRTLIQTIRSGTPMFHVKPVISGNSGQSVRASPLRLLRSRQLAFRQWFYAGFTNYCRVSDCPGIVAARNADFAGWERRPTLRKGSWRKLILPACRKLG